MLSTSSLAVSLRLLFAVPLLGMSHPRCVASARAEAGLDDSTADRLKQAVREATQALAGSGASVVVKPRYRVGSNTVWYHLGEVNQEALGSDEQFAMVVYIQLRVQMLEELFRTEAENEQFWQAPIARLTDIANQTSASLDFNRRAVNREFNNALRELEDAIEASAAARGLGISRTKSARAEDVPLVAPESDPEPGSDSEPEPLSLAEKLFGINKRKPQVFAVKVVTDPPNATIEYINFVDLQLATYYRREPNWQTLATDKLKLLGVYQFMVTWPDGRKTSHKITVSSTDQITIRKPNR